MIINLEDLRTEARRRLPRAVFDFIDGGAEDEVTLRANRDGFERLTFCPRVLVDVSTVDLATTVLGQRIELPVVLAPTGVCGMAAPRGEVPAARAATAAGTVFTLSTMSAVSIEDVAREAPGPHWFQLYIWKDRDLTRSLVERAAAAGYHAMMLTVDTPVLGQRERDVRNSVAIPPRITAANVVDSLAHFRWTWRMARARKIDLANFEGAHQGEGGRIFSLGAFVQSQFDPSISWRDVEWLRSIWSGPLAIKGIMSGADARLAVEAGVHAVVVSNHGGRQLDGLPGAIDVLAEVVDAVADRCEVILDGGVRRGSDVVKALALGARACMIGRPYLWGLAAGGERGVEQALAILRAEITRTLALVGRPSLATLDRTALRL